MTLSTILTHTRTPLTKAHSGERLPRFIPVWTGNSTMMDYNSDAHNFLVHVLPEQETLHQHVRIKTHGHHHP